MIKKVQGTINITSLGAGYVFGENIIEDIYIPSHLLNTALNGDEVEIIVNSKVKGEKLSEKEFDSSVVERISITFKQVEYMLERVGEIKEGVISKVASWGIYIQEIETRTEGMVRLKDMKDDFYVFSKETFSMTGQKTKKRYLLGDKVKIKIIGGDIKRKIINYNFV